MRSREELLRILPQPANRVLLDVGCGRRKQSGHIGLDSQPLAGVDIVTDIEKSWPIANGAVDEIYSNFAFEHVANFPALMQEVYRVCVPGARIVFRVPWYQSFTQYKDPTHKSFILPETIAYFTADSAWYGSDYNFSCEFKLLKVTYHYLPPFNYFAHPKLWMVNWIFSPILRVARRFLWNVVHSVTMELRRL